MRKLKKCEKGITLIALVITIIVLLILAGISIAMLTGENGILNKGTTAKEKTEEATAEEKVKLETAGSFNDEGKINLEDLNENLRKNIKGITYKGKEITETGAENENRIQSLPATVNVDGYNVVIRKDGSIVTTQWKQNDTEITNGDITLKIGDYVNYDELSNGQKSTTIGTEESGTNSSQSLSTENLSWRVLGIGENGGLELISDNPTTSTIGLYGEKGYLNGVKIINNTCNELYGKGKYAESARGLDIEDIKKFSDPSLLQKSPNYGNLWKCRFLENAEYMQYSESTDNGKTWSDWIDITNSSAQIFKMPGKSEIISKENPGESEEIRIRNEALWMGNLENEDIRNVLCGTMETATSFILASQSTNIPNGCVEFSFRAFLNSLDGIMKEYTAIYSSDNSSYERKATYRIVVSLQPDIELEGSSENGWTIK